MILTFDQLKIGDVFRHNEFECVKAYTGIDLYPVFWNAAMLKGGNVRRPYLCYFLPSERVEFITKKIFFLRKVEILVLREVDKVLWQSYRQRKIW